MMMMMLGNLRCLHDRNSIIMIIITFTLVCMYARDL